MLHGHPLVGEISFCTCMFNLYAINLILTAQSKRFIYALTKCVLLSPTNGTSASYNQCLPTAVVSHSGSWCFSKHGKLLKLISIGAFKWSVLKSNRGDSFCNVY